MRSLSFQISMNVAPIFTPANDILAASILMVHTPANVEKGTLTMVNFAQVSKKIKECVFEFITKT